MGNTEAVKIISALPGVDFTVMNNDGVTLAGKAVSSNVESVKILAEVEQFNWNVVDNEGDSPLMITLKKNETEMFNVLVDCPRVDLNMRDRNGDTVAMWTLKNNKLEEFKKIVESDRCDPSLADEDGETILTLARSMDLNDEMMELIPGTIQYKYSRRLKNLEEQKVFKPSECPVCLDDFAADMRIFQCINGHLICERCKASLQRMVCPRCNQNLSGRAHDFEDFLRNNL